MSFRRYPLLLSGMSITLLKCEIVYWLWDWLVLFCYYLNRRQFYLILDVRHYHIYHYHCEVHCVCILCVYYFWHSLKLDWFIVKFILFIPFYVMYQLRSWIFPNASFLVCLLKSRSRNALTTLGFLNYQGIDVFCACHHWQVSQICFYQITCPCSWQLLNTLINRIACIMLKQQYTTVWCVCACAWVCVWECVRSCVRACVRVWACVHNHVCIFYVVHLAAHLKRKTKPYYVRLCTLSN